MRFMCMSLKINDYHSKYIRVISGKVVLLWSTFFEGLLFIQILNSDGVSSNCLIAIGLERLSN